MIGVLPGLLIASMKTIRLATIDETPASVIQWGGRAAETKLSWNCFAELGLKNVLFTNLFTRPCFQNPILTLFKSETLSCTLITSLSDRSTI